MYAYVYERAYMYIIIYLIIKVNLTSRTTTIERMIRSIIIASCTEHLCKYITFMSHLSWLLSC